VSAGTVSVVRDNLDGSYQATVKPPSDSSRQRAWSGELKITAKIDRTNKIVERTAVVLPFVDPGWKQPEMVPGMVNTPGWEDSVEVSPDGQWLIVGTYFPLDLSRCEAGSPSSSLDANKIIGPYQPPLRPGLFGAERVLSRTKTRHECPSLGLTEAMGLALPPAAAYGFRRQPDGSFGDPFVIGFDMDGYPWGGPFAFTFLGRPQGNRAKLMFSWNDFTDSPDTGIDQFVVDAKLGEPIVLGTYKWNTQHKVTVLSEFSSRKLALSGLGAGTPKRQSNGHFAGGWLWFDDETVSDNLWVSRSIDGRDMTKWNRPQIVPLASKTETPRGQPFFDAPILYFTSLHRGKLAIYSAELKEADPTKERAWSNPKRELVCEAADWKSGRTGSIVGMGEASIARPNADEIWLYFVYIQKTASGVNANVGRVQRRLVAGVQEKR